MSEKEIINEATETLKRLSPNNQRYFMTLVRVAEAAENGVKGKRNDISKELN